MSCEGAGGSDSGCGSSTAIFIKYIQSLLPEGLAVEEEFQQVYCHVVDLLILPFNHM